MLKTISDLYKFYLYHPINGLIEVSPNNPTLEWSWEKNKEENQAFNRKKLNTELVFNKNDFFLFYDLERSNYKCEKLHLDIHRECNGIFSLYHTGYFALIDGDYDRDKCVVRIKLRQNDEYSCIFQQWTKEKDFIGGVGAPPSPGEIQIQQGTIEYQSCVSDWYFNKLLPDQEAYPINPETYPIVTNCLTDANTWEHVGNQFINIRLVSLGEESNIGYEFRVQSDFAREVAISGYSSAGFAIAPQGEGWIFVSTDMVTSVWVRPLAGDYNTAIQEPIKNGRRLNDVIQYLLNECELTLVSDFFNFNRDNTSPSNFAYDHANQFCKHLIIWQKSDVKRQPRTITDSNGNSTTLPFQSATKALIKLKDLLNWLNIMYNVKWKIIGNQFRIEHYTYWNSEKQNLIDITGNSRIKGLYRYKYEVEELPASETWQWMEETDKSDFDGLPIFYSETCSYGDDDGKDVEYTANKITTNIEYIVNNPSKISDDGFVIASMGESYNLVEGVKLFLLSSNGIISGQNKINASNSFANLLYYLHRHGRPQRQGNMNGTDEVFYFPKPTRQGPDVVVPMCCNEVETFDTNFRVKTQMGWGNMVSAKLKDPNGIMTISLLHE